MVMIVIESLPSLKNVCDHLEAEKKQTHTQKHKNVSDHLEDKKHTHTHTKTQKRRETLI
jgi:hypothetical protein